jgi:uncharacterized membrane protein
MIVNRKQRENIKFSLMFIVVYPLVAYLAFHYLGPIFVAITDFSKATFSAFPLVLIHGLLLMILGLGVFFLFILGFYIWVLSLMEIGKFLLDVASKK